MVAILRPINCKAYAFKKWTQLQCQGIGMEAFQTLSSNDWIIHQRRMNERHKIMALKLWANIYPTREFLKRGQSGMVVKCQHCQVPTHTVTLLFVQSFIGILVFSV